MPSNADKFEERRALLNNHVPSPAFYEMNVQRTFRAFAMIGRRSSPQFVVGVTESARAHSYLLSKQVQTQQKTGQFWLLTLWLFTFWLFKVYFRDLLTLFSDFVYF